MYLLRSPQLNENFVAAMLQESVMKVTHTATTEQTEGRGLGLGEN